MALKMKRSSRLAAKKCMEMLLSMSKKSSQKSVAKPPSKVTKVFKNSSKKAFQQTFEMLPNKTSNKKSEESSRKASKRRSETFSRKPSKSSETYTKKASGSLKPSSESYRKSLESKSKAVVLASQIKTLNRRIIKTSKKASQSLKPSSESYQKSLESNSKAVSLRQSKICMICKRSFTSEKKLKDHNTKHHFFRHCPNCPKTFQQTRKFILHLRSHLLDHPYECKICLESFNQKGDLLNHKKGHTNPERLHCDMCSEVFPHWTSLRRHRLAHKGPPYSCDICSAVFSKFPDASVHLKNHVYRCNFCPKEVIAFPTVADLASHVCNVHQNQDENEVMGNLEPCVSNGAVNLEEDGDSDSMEDFSSTDDESDADVDNNYQRDAVEPVYDLKRKDKFICFICYDLYPSCELLKSHMKAHKWYPCNSCPSFFSDANTLAQHKCNFGVPTFRCNICNTEIKCENCGNLRNDISEVNMNALQSIVPEFLELPRIPSNYCDDAEISSLFNFVECVKSQKGPLDIQSFNHVGFHTICLKQILKNPQVRRLYPKEYIPYIEELHSKFNDLSQILCNRMNHSLVQ